MQITTKQTLVFRVVGQKDFVLRPTQNPVAAPEYIRGTHLFKLAVSDRTVQEFIPVSPAAPADDKAKATADADAKAKAGADAKAAADKDAKKGK